MNIQRLPAMCHLNLTGLILVMSALPLLGQGPRISVPDDIWEFGAVPQHQELKHKFKIVNSGDKILEIRGVRPSCQCAAAMPEKKRLNPGDSTNIEVSLRTLTFSGVLHKVVTVDTNDPTRPTYTLELKGQVMPPYYVVPASLEMGTFSKSQASREMPFSLVISPGASLKIKGITTTSNLLSVVPDGGWEDRADGARVQKYIARFTTGAPVGLLRESIWINSDLPTRPRLDVMAIGTVTGEVTTLPATLNLGRIAPGTTVKTPFVVTKSGAANLDVLKAVPNPSDVFEAEVKEVERGRKYEVYIKIKDSAKKGYKKGTISIHTNVKGEKLLQAYFYAFIQG